MREMAKGVLRGLATVAVLPRLAVYRVAASLFGRDRALEGASQSLARVPGLHGEYMRRAFLSRVLRGCHQSATICWGSVFSKADAVIEENVYVGAGCHLGLVHLEHDVLLASGVHIPSGSQTHGAAAIDRPIRDQPGRLNLVRIGAGSWVGSAAVVMADVGPDTIVAAGAVVTKPVPALVVAGGVPARVLRSRTADVGHPS